MKTEGKAPKGTWASAYLVTDYMAVENRKLPSGVKDRWCRPRSPRRMARLRRMLLDCLTRQGIDVQAVMFWPRPTAGRPFPPLVEVPFPGRRA